MMGSEKKKLLKVNAQNSFIFLVQSHLRLFSGFKRDFL